MSYSSTKTPNLFGMMFAAQQAYLDMFSQMARTMTAIPTTPARPSPFHAARQFDIGQREQVIGVGEEKLNVSTRRVSGEPTRVRRVVRETPVERRVELNDETITIERRAANGKPADTDALVEREYVMIDTREIPVVTKEAHLREELVVRRERTGRVEVIRDTVRHADVEVTQPQRMPMVVAMGANKDHESHQHQHQEQHSDQQHQAS